MLDYKILIKGGSLCFFGKWFGRPYDNFHHIKRFQYNNDTLFIEFSNGEFLTVIKPLGITNEESMFSIKDCKQLIWEYVPYGKIKDDLTKIVYTRISTSKVIEETNAIKSILKGNTDKALSCV